MHVRAKGDKKPSTAMSVEIVRLYAFAAPGSPLAQHRSSISTEEFEFNPDYVNFADISDRME